MKNKWLVIILCLAMVTSMLGIGVPETALAVNTPTQPSWSPLAAATKPNAPSNLVAKAIATGQIKLTWQDKSNDEARFEIWRKDGPSSTYTITNAVGTNVTAFTDTNLASATTYYYKIRTSNTAGFSDYSNEASATLPGKERPNAPSNLVAAALSPTQIRIDWKNNSSNADYLVVMRETGTSGTLREVKRMGGGVYWIDTSVTANTTYYYQVGAANAAGTSLSSPANVTTPGTPGSTPPKAPSDLTASATSTNRVNVTWKDNSDNEIGFWVERRRAASSTWSGCMYVQQNITSSVVSQEPNSTYYYRAYALNTAGSKSAYSNEVMVTTLPKETPQPHGIPTAPSDLTVTVISPTHAKYTWKDNSDNEKGFWLEHKRAGADWQGPMWAVTQLSPNITMLVQGGLDPNTAYIFRVRAFNDKGGSFSNEVSATTPPCDATAGAEAPVLKSPASGAGISNRNLRLEWVPTKAEGLFDLQIATDPNFSKVIGVWRKGGFPYTDMNGILNWNTTYYWRVRAKNACGESPWSPAWSFKIN